LKSTSTVHAHLKVLQRLGYIDMPSNKQRSITLHMSDKGVTPVALVGTVAAGQPIYAADNIQDTFSLPSSLLKGAKPTEVFALSIAGDSMVDAGILNGDMVLVNNSLAIENGDIAVVRVDGDTATVKRVYIESTTVRLQPENAAMQPIIVGKERVDLVGKVVGLIRRY
ncbi:MAG: transcriptional repressor LexA, partial [Clostridia bacterium]|nr:transcriptional repressor LexA [Clostridia bacterium]